MSQPVSQAGPGKALRRNIFTLEKGGVIEEMYVHTDHIALLLREPMRCGACGTMHVFFFNRDGRTRCCQCDDRIRISEVS